MRQIATAAVILAAASAALATPAATLYKWLSEYEPEESIERRIAPPAGYRRVNAAAGSFEAWLRGLPLKPGRPAVMLFDGRPKANQEAHHAVLDLDVGTRDLQQCADSVIRLRAEWLYASDRRDDIHFNFTSGDRADFSKWAHGFRPVVRGNKVTWSKTAAPDASYRSFRPYLDVVFTYAGTASLSAEMAPVADVKSLRAGDVFIVGGSPGHVVIVVDVAADPRSDARVFLLAQGYMPAQEMHVLRNPNDATLSPWYRADFGDTLRTPEYTFRKTDLKRF